MADSHAPVEAFWRPIRSTGPWCALWAIFRARSAGRLTPCGHLTAGGQVVVCGRWVRFAFPVGAVGRDWIHIASTARLTGERRSMTLTKSRSDWFDGCIQPARTCEAGTLRIDAIRGAGMERVEVEAVVPGSLRDGDVFSRPFFRPEPARRIHRSRRSCSRPAGASRRPPPPTDRRRPRSRRQTEGTRAVWWS